MRYKVVMVELIQDFSQDQPNSSGAFDHVIIDSESTDRVNFLTLTMTSLPPKVPKKLRDIPDVVSVYYTFESLYTMCPQIKD